MNTRLFQQGSKVTRQGMTLIEVLIASSIMVAVWGGILLVISEAVREQSRSLAGAALEQSASLLQDRLMSLLRGMSENESVVFATPSAGTEGFSRIIVAQGQAPDYPREEIRFDQANHTLIHDPNRIKAGDEMHLYVSSPEATLRQLFFYPALKTGGIPDNACLNIWIEMDDNGWPGRRCPDGSIMTNTVVRTFSVRMRNP